MSNRAITWAMSADLPTTRKFVLVVLADLADENDSCFPGQPRIAATIGASVRTVRDALGQLEESGYIIRHERRRLNGSRTSTRYVLQLSR